MVFKQRFLSGVITLQWTEGGVWFTLRLTNCPGLCVGHLLWHVQIEAKIRDAAVLFVGGEVVQLHQEPKSFSSILSSTCPIVESDWVSTGPKCDTVGLFFFFFLPPPPVYPFEESQLLFFLLPPPEGYPIFPSLRSLSSIFQRRHSKISEIARDETGVLLNPAIDAFVLLCTCASEY